MKAWLASAAKFTAEFLILLALLSLAGAFSATMGEPKPWELLLATAREAIKLWPLSVALAIGLGMVSFRAMARSRLVIVLSVCFLGSLFALIGTAARLLPEATDASSPEAPVTGMAVVSGGRLLSVASIEGGTARNVAAVDFDAAWPRLLWSSALPLFEKDGTLNLAGSTWTLARTEPSFPPALPPFIGSIPLPLSGPENLGFLPALAAALAFTLLCVGFATAALGIRWPLAALTLALVAISLACAAERWLSAPYFRETLASELATRKLSLDPDWLRLGLEGLIGLASASIGLLFSRRLDA